MVGAALVTALTVGGKVVNAVPKIVGFIKGVLGKSKDPERDVEQAFNDAKASAVTTEERQVIEQQQQQAREYIRIWFANLDPNSLPPNLRDVNGLPLETALKKIKMYKTLRGKDHPWQNVQSEESYDTGTNSENTGIAPVFGGGLKGGVSGVSAWVSRNPVFAALAAVLLFFIIKKR